MSHLDIILSEPQIITGSWDNIGVGQIDTDGYENVTLFAGITINDSQNVRIRAMGRCTDGGENYSLPIRTVTPSKVSVDPEYYELNQDASQKITIPFNLGKVTPYVIFQIMAVTPGATPGQITVCNMTAE